MIITCDCAYCKNMRGVVFKGNGNVLVERVALTKREPFTVIPTVFYAFYTVGMCYTATQVDGVVGIYRF